MSNKCVVVLAPNGRRQNVKVTPNTTILQVLEEVCRKQGFKAEEYDILHHNKVLDATSIIRYTGLPNNAQLEMAAALKTRAESRVKVGLALESGDRVMGEFEPLDSLWHVVQTLCPNETETNESDEILPVIFYLGREECGIENLKKTTLRSLGLTSGGAILRFFKKARDELNRQANVSAPLLRPMLVQEPTAIEPCKSNPQKSTENPSLHVVGPSTSPEVEHPDTPEVVQCRPEEPVSLNPTKDQSTCSPRGNENTNRESAVEDRSTNEEMSMEYEDTSQCTTQSSSTESPPLLNLPQKDAPSDESEETIIFLGDRNAVLFDVTTARACKAEDVPDDFFDLTVDDAKQLLRDMKRRQAALEEQPLVTSQYRELEKSKQMLSALNQYKRCIIKVQFPNQLVLQGTFTPLEKVSHVIDFVRKYLQEPSIDFEIFTTPPKQVLIADQTLFDANCVPGALVYFLSNTCPTNGSYIREDVMAQVSTASAAASAAASMRRNVVPRKSAPIVKQEPSASGSSQHPTRSNTDNAPKSIVSSDKKVPKWFKPK
ncbi:Tether containing UBX domain for GLUT4 [Frankliniella fusca]|uniref:Tether containing UBX domain for GLUT4 n=1 Tax=Frankliniella fusca TaxID=407009 RepID=A0AAE1I0J3_9NEOP|nr:Tether containing UBX domain for GLUT4 [Frankliniella fusca]